MRYLLLLFSFKDESLETYPFSGDTSFPKVHRISLAMHTPLAY